MADHGPLSGLRLLIVEDEYMVATHLEMLLENCGCEVVGPVATVDKALELMEAERLDGVLLDANLNGISSAPLADFLNARSVPFVVVTGYGRLELATETLSAAPRIGKPFSKAEFEKVLTSTFRR
ncbi:response regulator [Sphingomonas ginkgonis]|uniref:Response regulator n=1 Tax=Sphingomonas ginkgonis TaxID=2315330 RepID=A0A429VBH2_9SPHN|nr:response regulator [Sphingomonas ginkgonis]RST31304.1 response regulator [Sphingomonas ginkgonis]